MDPLLDKRVDAVDPRSLQMLHLDGLTYLGLAHNIRQLDRKDTKLQAGASQQTPELLPKAPPEADMVLRICSKMTLNDVPSEAHRDSSATVPNDLDGRLSLVRPQKASLPVALLTCPD